MYDGRYDFEEEVKSNDKIIAEALIQIIENQMDIKRHFGITQNYEDNYYDNETISKLKTID